MTPKRLFSCSMAMVMEAQVLTDTKAVLYDIPISKESG
jgi:hypothetical protein